MIATKLPGCWRRSRGLCDFARRWRQEIPPAGRNHRRCKCRAAPTDVAAFAEALAAIDINGERYPANLMATTGL
ncbi:hypothetical protein [Caballeronia zhejiangensis]|uniref:hypothetical protein n=1 Tax=Caballeronia zhejiangensis TaxID=871203 RepID=UPI001EF71D2E|nr:hypothetical protein [Caballeronia zhejiangensis]MCG7400296.1 hypothetical protein [Caballeronia zhejiangensis]